MDEQGKFEALKLASRLTWRDWGDWLYDTWQQHNIHYFGGALRVIPLYFGNLAHGAKLGIHHSGEYPRIDLHYSLLEPSFDYPQQKQSEHWGMRDLLGHRMASDVLLHEMVHQSIHERLGHDGSDDAGFSGASSHNNPYWCDEIMRISPLIGLQGIKAQPIKRKRMPDPATGKKTKLEWFVEDGYLSRDELSSWPHSVTDDQYYRGESDNRSVLHS